MSFPGETLIIKLWETITEKGIASLLKPWQTRREGHAQIDLRRFEILALASAEREAEEIRSGRRKLANTRYVLSLTENITEEKPQTEKEDIPLLEVATRATIADTMRKEVNVAKAVIHAENHLKDNQASPPEKKIDDDWLYRWRDYAGTVSTEDLQALWGKILAGELCSPGRYSYRLLDFVRNLSKDEADLIEKIAPFVISGIIVRNHAEDLEEEILEDGYFENTGSTFDLLLKLQELGILSGVEALGLTIEIYSNRKDRYLKVLQCHGSGLVIEHADAKKVLTLGSYSLTKIGSQVIGLGDFTPNEKYLVAVGAAIQKSGFKVRLTNYTSNGDGTIRCSHLRDITDTQLIAVATPPSTQD